MYFYVRAMDDIIDENVPNHALEKQKTNVLMWRNQGIGVMGMHDMFIKLGIVYGSERSIQFISKLTNSIFKLAV